MICGSECSSPSFENSSGWAFCSDKQGDLRGWGGSSGPLLRIRFVVTYGDRDTERMGEGEGGQTEAQQTKKVRFFFPKRRRREKWMEKMKKKEKKEIESKDKQQRLLGRRKGMCRRKRKPFGVR